MKIRILLLNDDGSVVFEHEGPVDRFDWQADPDQGPLIEGSRLEGYQFIPDIKPICY